MIKNVHKEFSIRVLISASFIIGEKKGKEPKRPNVGHSLKWLYESQTIDSVNNI